MSDAKGRPAHPPRGRAEPSRARQGRAPRRRALVMRLLEKSPNERYPSARRGERAARTSLCVRRPEKIPTAMIRDTLVRAGLSEKSMRPAPSSSDERARRRRPSRRRSRSGSGQGDTRGAHERHARPSGSCRSLVVFGALMTLYVVGVIANEGTSTQREARDGLTATLATRRAGERAGGRPPRRRDAVGVCEGGRPKRRRRRRSRVHSARRRKHWVTLTIRTRSARRARDHDCRRERR